MAFCNTGCGPASPVNFGSSCEQTSRKAGISRPFLIDCSYDFTDIDDSTEWESAILAKRVYPFPIGIGSVELPSANVERFSSCLPETATSFTYTVNYRTAQVDNSNLTDVTFWNYWNQYKNYNKATIGFEGCDGLFYLRVGTGADNPGYQFSLVQGGFEKVEEGDVNSQFYYYNVSFQETGILKAFDITGLAQVFNTVAIPS